MTTETSESEEAVIMALTMPTVRATVILATPGADCRQGDWEREERGEERGRRAEGGGRREGEVPDTLTTR
jgi:hypothetical protein